MVCSTISSAYLPDALKADMKWESPVKNSFIAENIVANIANMVITCGDE